MKSKLSVKITSSEQLSGIVSNTSDYIRSVMNVYSGQFSGPLEYPANGMWWLAREYMRIFHGVYIETEVTRALNRSFAAQYCVHVSNEDRNMIAFTPTVEMGQQDRQLKMAIGKFMRKYFLLWTDEQIQKMEARHRSEINATFEIATTKEEIYKVYTSMVGDSGCMRHTKTHFDTVEHPSAVYEAPGMGVAYTKDSDGAIKSRSVVWVNPSDETDKRYVRIYGDSILCRLLERAGYRKSHLAGAKFKAILQEGTQYVFPYLDGPGGAQSELDGSYVAMLDDNWLLCLTSKEAKTLDDGEQTVVRCKSTGGRISLRRITDIEYVSDFSGIKYSRLVEPKFYYMVDGQVKTIARKETETLTNVKSVLTLVNGDRELVLVPADSAVFYYLRDWLDTPENRANCGFTKLSPVYYPEGRWSRDVVITPDNLIDHDDAVEVLPASGPAYRVHESKLRELRKLGYLNCYHRVSDIRRVIHKDRATLTRTDKGVVFDRECSHPYAQLYDGSTWVSRRNSASIRFMQHDYILRKCERLPVEVKKNAIKSSRYVCELIDALADSSKNYLYKKDLFDHTFIRICSLTMAGRLSVNGDEVSNNYSGTPNYSTLVEVMEFSRNNPYKYIPWSATAKEDNEIVADVFGELLPLCGEKPAVAETTTV